MTITELAIKRPTLIVVVFLALGLAGLYGYFQLRYELLPKVEPPFVVISTMYPGASPSEVESGVTKPVEDAVSSIEKISNIFASSYEGLSVVSIEFKYAADVNQSMQNVQRKVNGILMSLPRDIRTPVVQKWSLEDVPIIQMGVTSAMAPREFYQFLKDQIQPAFGKIDGVGQVRLLGGDIREIKINLDAEKVRGYGLSIAQVTQIVKASNLDFPTGTVKTRETQAVVRVSGKFSSTDELRSLVISRIPGGGEVRLGDIAEIEDGHQDNISYSRINGKATVGIHILKQSDANAVEVSKRVRARIAELEGAYGRDGLKFDIVADGSLFTIEAADAVKKDLLTAVLLVSAVMFLFLHSVRNSIIILIAIPASLLAAVLAMLVLDFSLNLMTLLALSLVIGILVDDSIVVLENIHHFLEKGEEKRSAALRGRNEIGFAALSITLVDVVVFLPLTLIVGLVGDIMREFSIVIVVSTLMSLVVSFTLTPMLSSRFAKLEHPSAATLGGRIALGFEALWRRLTARYDRLLGWSLRHPGRVAAGATFLLAGAILLPASGLVGSEFMKQTDRGEFIVRIELAPSASLEYTNMVSQRIERLLAAVPEVRKIQANVGIGAQDVAASNTAGIYVLLSDRTERARSTDEIANEVKRKTRQIPGIKVFIDQIAITGAQYGAGVQVMVRGADPDSLRAMVDAVAHAMRRTPSVTDVMFSSEQGKPEVRIEIDRQKMATFGLTVFDVGTALRVALTGDDESKYREGQFEHPIRIMLDKFDRSNPDDVARLSFVTPAGNSVELQQFAQIFPASGPSKLDRFNRSASVTVTGYVDNSLSLGIVASKFTELLGTARAGGTSVAFTGDEKDRAESFGQMGAALLASILCVYFILVALYDSFIHPFVVLFSVPLALIGAIGALALSGNALGIFSILGIIMMVGLVTKNAILLVDRTNENRENGLPLEQSLLEAGQARMRPIVMTTLSMVFGMMPIALASGAGSEWKNGLAWALIGGLLSSMFLTLIVVPIVYTKVDRLRRILPVLFRHPFSVKWLRRVRAFAAGRREEAVSAAGVSSPPAGLLLLFLLLAAATAAASGGAPLPPAADAGTSGDDAGTAVLRIGLVTDGPWDRNKEVFAQLQSVLREVVGNRVRIEWAGESPSGIIEGDWTLRGVREINSRLLADSRVDMILGLGVIASHDLATRGPLPKPVIAPVVLDPERQKIPLTRGGTSGVRNLSYLLFPMTFKEDVGLFRTLVPFTKLVCVTSRRYSAALPLARVSMEEAGKSMGIALTRLEIDSSASEALSAIPHDAEAIYLEPTLHIPQQEFRKLVAGFIGRHLPSFSFLGESEVRQGIMAGANADFLPRLIRRIALHVQRILEGEDPASLSVAFPASRRLFYNLRTAYGVSATPNWDVLLESELIDADMASPFAEHIDLPSAVKRIAESNLDIQAVTEGVNADAENVAVARSGLLPRIDLGLNAYQIDDDRAQAGFQPNRAASGAVSVSQLLFSEPAIANLSIQSSLYDSRLSELDQARLNTIADGAGAYMNFLRVRRLFTILLENLKITRSNYELAQVRRTTGAAGEEEPLRWKVEIAEMKKAVMTLEAQMNQARYLLNQHLNYPLNQPLDAGDVSLGDTSLFISNRKIQSYISNPMAFNLLTEYLVAQGLERSPEIKQLDAGIEAQDRGLRSTRFSYFVPAVSAYATYTNNFYRSEQPAIFSLGSIPAPPAGLDPNVPRYLGQLLSAVAPALPDRNDWTVGLQFSFNLFSGFSTRASEAKTRQQLEQLKLTRASTAEKLALRIRSSMQGTKASYFAIAQSEAEQDAAHRALQLVTDAYSRGAVPILNVLDAQNSALRADQVAVNALYDFFVQYMQLQRSLGRFDLLMTAGERADYLNGLIDRIDKAMRR